MLLYTFPDRCLAEHRNDYLDEDMPDEDDTNATPASPIPSQPSRSASSSPSPLANKSHAPPQNSMPAWDMCKTVCLAGGDFALLTTRTSSMRYAADFQSTVGNVSFSYIYLKQSNYL